MHTISKVVEAAKLYAKGLTTKEVSEQTGVSEHTLSNWRTKHSSSYITKLVKRNTKSSSGNKGVSKHKVVTEKRLRNQYNQFKTDEEIAEYLEISAEAVEAWRQRDRLPKWLSAKDIGLSLKELRNLSTKEASKVKGRMALYFFREIKREFPKGNRPTPPIGGVLKETQRRIAQQRLHVSFDWIKRWHKKHSRMKRIPRGFYNLELHTALSKATQHS